MSATILPFKRKLPPFDGEPFAPFSVSVILLATPAAAPYQLLHKLELVDDLVTRERIEGESSANFPAMGMASLKIDLMNLTEIMKAAEVPG